MVTKLYQVCNLPEGKKIIRHQKGPEWPVTKAYLLVTNIYRNCNYLGINVIVTGYRVTEISGISARVKNKNIGTILKKFAF